MNSKQNEVIYGLSFFAIIVGVALLGLSLVNDFTSMNVFQQSPYVLSVAILAVGGIMVFLFSNNKQGV